MFWVYLNIPAVAGERSFVMGAPVHDVVRDRAQHAARRHRRDPIATCNSSRRAERLVLAAEDQTKTIVADTSQP
jgi:hypothetical protein